MSTRREDYATLRREVDRIAAQRDDAEERHDLLAAAAVAYLTEGTQVSLEILLGACLHNYPPEWANKVREQIRARQRAAERGATV